MSAGWWRGWHAGCRSTADVVAAVDLAQGEGLEVATRGGGHSISGLLSTEGGVLIDLRDLVLPGHGDPWTGGVEEPFGWCVSLLRRTLRADVDQRRAAARRGRSDLRTTGRVGFRRATSRNPARS